MQNQCTGNDQVTAQVLPAGCEHFFFFFFKKQFTSNCTHSPNKMQDNIVQRIANRLFE